MKILKIISGIVYFLFTMTFGVILAVYLPNVYAIKEAMNIMEDSFNSGDYDTAMSMAGGLYDKDYVLQTDFEHGGGIVLFSAGSLISGKADDKEVDNAKMHKAYTGFVYGVKDTYLINSNDSNQAKVVVTDKENKTHDISIIDYDSDGDKNNDSIYTYELKGYFYLDIGQEITNSISKIELVDKDGKVFAEVAANLEYSEKFFEDVEPFINEYNADFKSENLTSLRDELLSKDDSYKQTGMKIAETIADKKAAVVVVVYFIVIYVIADFILGSHFIIKFVKWILVKVFKVKFKEKKPKHTELFGHDYFCKLTITADVSEIEDFNESVQVRFSNENGEITYVLLKGRNYTETNSVKAGEYVNLWVDLDNKYITQNLPDTIEVEGYQKTITFKILNRED